MIQLDVEINVEDLMRELRKFGEHFVPAVGVGMEAIAAEMLVNVTRKVSGPYINVDTGTLRFSMDAFRERVGAEGWRAGISNPFDYVRAHERGFKGAVNVRQHAREVKQVFGRRLATPVTATVRAHQRQLNIRARHFMRDAVEEESRGAPRMLARVMVAMAKLGRVPALGEF